MNEQDGISLFSTAHPVPSWPVRLWLWFRRVRGLKGIIYEEKEIKLSAGGLEQFVRNRDC